MATGAPRRSDLAALGAGQQWICAGVWLAARGSEAREREGERGGVLGLAFAEGVKLSVLSELKSLLSPLGPLGVLPTLVRSGVGLNARSWCGVCPAWFMGAHQRKPMELRVGAGQFGGGIHLRARHGPIAAICSFVCFSLTRLRWLNALHAHLLLYLVLSSEDNT